MTLHVSWRKKQHIGVLTSKKHLSDKLPHIRGRKRAGEKDKILRGPERAMKRRT